MIETTVISGRESKPFLNKINPVWWFGNDDEQQLPDWYHPTWSYANRSFFWLYLRNPLQNFRCYVIGVADKNYNIKAKAPALTVQRSDLQPPETGFQWCVLYGGDLWLPRWFLSYSGWLNWYVGWQPTGIYGWKLHL